MPGPLQRLRRARQARALRAARIPWPVWRRATAGLSCLKHLDRAERVRLRGLASLFLREKVLVGVQGLELDEDMAAAIAAQACLPVLALGLERYRGFREVVVYPDAFVAPREAVDEGGLVHQWEEALDGEAWSRGPVILSWADARPGGMPHGPGTNVVLHEFAHKLDMENGPDNGMPPLHRDMDPRAWTRAFSRAYADLERGWRERGEAPLDPYALESPGEFFAVATEAFFETPRRLRQAFPEVYAQLRAFYRQDPAARITPPPPCRPPRARSPRKGG